ncbi:MAG: hypothetical protein IT427_07745 [Pirellulales bacterium]|nr:hypothetical protein [Pirellulales bacterium]
MLRVVNGSVECLGQSEGGQCRVSIDPRAASFSREGAARTANSSKKTSKFGKGGARGGARFDDFAHFGRDVAQRIDHWPTLPAAIESSILAMVEAAVEQPD